MRPWSYSRASPLLFSPDRETHFDSLQASFPAVLHDQAYFFEIQQLSYSSRAADRILFFPSHIQSGWLIKARDPASRLYFAAHIAAIFGRSMRIKKKFKSQLSIIELMLFSCSVFLVVVCPSRRHAISDPHECFKSLSVTSRIYQPCPSTLTIALSHNRIYYSSIYSTFPILALTGISQSARGCVVRLGKCDVLGKKYPCLVYSAKREIHNLTW